MFDMKNSLLKRHNKLFGHTTQKITIEVEIDRYWDECDYGHVDISLSEYDLQELKEKYQKEFDKEIKTLCDDVEKFEETGGEWEWPDSK